MRIYVLYRQLNQSRCPVSMLYIYTSHSPLCQYRLNIKEQRRTRTVKRCKGKRHPSANSEVLNQVLIYIEAIGWTMNSRDGNFIDRTTLCADADT